MITSELIFFLASSTARLMLIMFLSCTSICPKRVLASITRVSGCFTIPAELKFTHLIITSQPCPLYNKLPNK